MFSAPGCSRGSFLRALPLRSRDSSHKVAVDEYAEGSYRVLSVCSGGNHPGLWQVDVLRPCGNLGVIPAVLMEDIVSDDCVW